jgi:predicted transcriptional regulator
MEGEELRFRFNPKTGKWHVYFGCPDKVNITCAGCKRLIRQGQRVYLNFDNGEMYCEADKENSLTNFVQGGLS